MLRYITAIWLTPGGSSTVHIYTQTQNIENGIYVTINKFYRIIWEVLLVPRLCELYFALQLRKNHGKTSVSLAAGGFGGLEVVCWSLVLKFACSNPAEAVGFFRVKKSSARLPSEGK
jgi:hypothetical protein